MIVGLVSSYREGNLLRSCVASAKTGCDVVAVFEGPVGDDVDPEQHPVTTIGAHHVAYGTWADDAAKRTAMLEWAKRENDRGRSLDSVAPRPLWVLWLDGDEVLLWGEYLRDWIERAEKITGVGGFPLRIVELDGSVAKAHGRIVRADMVRRYLLAAYQVELETGMVVALPNVKVCGPGGIPAGWGDGREVTPDDLAELRPPLAGEPHILHRPMLRDPAREATRQHEAEADWFPPVPG